METNTATVKGTCQQMCPNDEILMREKEGLLHVLEAMSVDEEDVTSRSRMCFKANPSRTVKQFSRPAAGRADMEPAHLRPASVLRETVSYLFENIVPREHPAWYNIYQFVFDRLRAVRQDMVIQEIVGHDAIGILEQVVRFHLYASYRLRDAAIDQYDPVINKQHLLECLKRLLYLYKVTPGPHVHQEEFESVYLLDNLGDNHAMTHFLDLEPEIRISPKLRHCYAISQAYVLKNYTRALRLIWRLRCAMCLCAVNPHLDILRINFLQILSAGYSVKNCSFPLTKLAELLHLESTPEALALCSLCGLVDHFDNPSAEVICFNRQAFCRPKEERPPASLQVLDKILSDEKLPPLLLSHGADNNSEIKLKSLRDALPNTETKVKSDVHGRQLHGMTGVTISKDSVECNRPAAYVGRGRGKVQSNKPNTYRVDKGSIPDTMEGDKSGSGKQILDLQGQMGSVGQGQQPGGVAVVVGSDCGQTPQGRGRGRGRGRRE